VSKLIVIFLSPHNNITNKVVGVIILFDLCEVFSNLWIITRLSISEYGSNRRVRIFFFLFINFVFYTLEPLNVRGNFMEIQKARERGGGTKRNSLM
jgi:hypothetical protein